MRNRLAMTVSRATTVLALCLAGGADPSAGVAMNGQLLPAVRRNYIRQPACLPVYGEAQEILRLYPETDNWGLAAADFNGDGWPDIVVRFCPFTVYATLETCFAFRELRCPSP